ncbi:MAG: hypothetical protein R3264_10095, partial [Anaerolineae bacterium]|nr:hypothetical protein [Anaerolineae bacterium]
DPDTLVVSGSSGAYSAHNDQHAKAVLYRRVNGRAWQPIYEGLPNPAGTRAYTLATNPAEPGVFYAATRQNLYRSLDAGESWERLAISWPDQADLNTVNAMVVTESQ